MEASVAVGRVVLSAACRHARRAALVMHHPVIATATLTDDEVWTALAADRLVGRAPGPSSPRSPRASEPTWWAPRERLGVDPVEDTVER